MDFILALPVWDKDDDSNSNSNSQGKEIMAANCFIWNKQVRGRLESGLTACGRMLANWHD